MIGPDRLAPPWGCFGFHQNSVRLASGALTLAETCRSS